MESQEDPNNISNVLEESRIIKTENIDEENLEVVTKPIVTIEQIIQWRKWFLAQKFSLDTVEMYESFIKRYVGLKVLVNQKTIDRFRESHMNTVSSSALKSLIKFLVYKKNYPESLMNIRFEKNKQSRKEPKIVTPEEVEKIILGFEDLKERLLTQTIFTLALRVEEAFKLRWSSFNWKEWINNKEEYGVVHLEGTKKGKFRNVPVNPVLMNNLYKNHAHNSEGLPIEGLVFGDINKLNEINKNKRLNEKLTDDQVKSKNQKYYLNLEKQKYRDKLYRISYQTIGRKISPHVFRHGKAQFLMDHNTPIETIKEILGHESIATTQIYAKASVKKIQEDMEKFDVVSKEINKEDIKYEKKEN